jgi:uncharacterized membrane protein YkgB
MSPAMSPLPRTTTPSVVVRDLAGAIRPAGEFVLRYGLAVVILWIAALKFTAAEAAAIQPLAANSPLLGWVYGVMSLQAFSNVLGVLELAIGLLLASGPFAPRLGALGAALGVPMFLTTLSFLATTPGMFEPALGGFPAPSAGGAFLLKDFVLLGGVLTLLAIDLGRHREGRVRTSRPENQPYEAAPPARFCP